LPKPTDPVPAPTLDSTTSFPTPSGQWPPPKNQIGYCHFSFLIVLFLLN
jgi:hypothetical protein